MCDRASWHFLMWLMKTKELPAVTLQDDLKVEYFLWQLFHIDQEMRRERRERRQHQQALQHLHQNVAASEAEVSPPRLV